MKPVVLLDRDGTINDDVGYLTDVANLVIYPYAIDAIRLLRRAGYAIVVITNQGAVARGLATTTFVEDTHRLMAATLDAGGAHVDAWRYCPHHPDGVTPALAAACRCRKPEPGLALDAASELGLDLSRSWMVGDHWRDVQMGHAVGARSILLRTGHGRDQEAARPPGQRVEAICDNLMHAVAVILTLRLGATDGALRSGQAAGGPPSLGDARQAELRRVRQSGPSGRDPSRASGSSRALSRGDGGESGIASRPARTPPP